MQTPGEFLAVQLTYMIPLLLVWFVGIVVAFFRCPHHFRSSALTAIALTTMIVASLFSVPLHYLGNYGEFLRNLQQQPGVDPAIFEEYSRSIPGQLVMELSSHDSDFPRIVMGFIPMFQLLQATAIAVLVFAIFSWREVTTQDETAPPSETFPDAGNSHDGS